MIYYDIFKLFKLIQQYMDNNNNISINNIISINNNNNEDEIYGKVIFVDKENKSRFHIIDESDRKIKCLCSHYCPVHIGDAINGFGKLIKVNRSLEFTFSSVPLVRISEDKNTITKIFTDIFRYIKIEPITAYKLFDKIEERGRQKKEKNTNKNLTEIQIGIKFLDKRSVKWNNLNSKHYLTFFLTVVDDEDAIIKLLVWWYKNRVLRKLYLLGFNNKDIFNIGILPNILFDSIQCNPYTVPELSLEKCDEILLRKKIKPDPTLRKCGEIVRKLYSYTSLKGWSAVPSKIFLTFFPDISKYFDMLIDKYGMHYELGILYLDYQYKVETSLTNTINTLLYGEKIGYTFTRDEIKFTTNKLSDDQKEAIMGALNNNICIVNGCAGSGKTTLTKEIIYNLDSKKIPYKIVSFTGMAVARIREVLGNNSPSTMNRLISERRNCEPFEHLIIDEVSMVTLYLLYEFMKKFPFKYKITLIGDNNQLVPIGWGCLMDQLIKSLVVPIYTLTMVHRTNPLNENNGIIINANAIIDYIDPEYEGAPFEFAITPNFNIIETDVSVISDIIQGFKNVNFNDDQIVIICPYNLDLDNLNAMFQSIYNGNNSMIRDNSGKIWRIGDRVMMKQNNYNINIMNKEQGKIVNIDNVENEIQVKFKNGTIKNFKISNVQNGDLNVSEKDRVLSINMLQLGYAITVDCSQGSEYDYVIYYIPLTAKNSPFLNRNRTYTAITRAKIAIWCVGNLDTLIGSAIRLPPYKCDNLALRLQMSQPKLPKIN